MQARERHYPLEPQWWDDWHQRRDEQARLNLIERYLPLARSIAYAIYKRQFRDGVEFEDYYQYALVGLLEALQRFNPQANIAFSTFATYRIRGAVFNGLAGLTEIRSRGSARLQKDRNESAMHHAKSSDPFETMVDATVHLAIGILLDEGEFDLEDPNEQNPERLHVQGELETSLKALVSALPDRERTVIHYHYFHGVPFETIATMLGVTRGRVSQIHHRALQRIRGMNDGQN